MNTFLCIKKDLRISGEVVVANRKAGGQKSDDSVEKYGSKVRLRSRRILQYALLGHKNKVRDLQCFFSFLFGCSYITLKPVPARGHWLPPEFLNSRNLPSLERFNLWLLLHS